MSIQAPPGFEIYDSYHIDPLYARRFTIGWTGIMASMALLYSPRLYRSIRSGRAWQGLGFWESTNRYEAVPSSTEKASKPPPKLARHVGALRALVHGPTMLSIPKTRLDLGQIAIVLAYLAILLVCLNLQAQLKTNSNRAGFLTLAQLPAVFLFATKNNPLSLILGRGYEKLHFLHRWSGRGLFLTATVHGSLWINNYKSGGIASQLKNRKPVLGMTAYGFLCMIVILSLRPVRKNYYQLFFISHVICFVSFFVIICYHTPYSIPWIFAPVSFYAFDLCLRLFRYRIKDAVLESKGSQMTLVHIPDVTGGWVAGQHVQLRVFFGARIFESHSFTITNAPRSISTLPSSSSFPGGITLGARVTGDWTRSLNALAQNGEKGKTQVTVMMDGPYGGSSLDYGEFENVLLVSGGSGVTFALGVLDDLVGRIVKLGRPGGERTRNIEFVWYIRSFGAIMWFEPMLSHIAQTVLGTSLNVRMQFFVTCLCDPEGLPSIPNSAVELAKPSIASLLAPLLTSTQGPGAVGAGVGVAASGPETLTREARNAVARVGPRTAKAVGGVEIHTELFEM